MNKTSERTSTWFIRNENDWITIESFREVSTSKCIAYAWEELEEISCLASSRFSLRLTAQYLDTKIWVKNEGKEGEIKDSVTTISRLKDELFNRISRLPLWWSNQPNLLEIKKTKILAQLVLTNTSNNRGSVVATGNIHYFLKVSHWCLRFLSWKKKEVDYESHIADPESLRFCL
jgi:hypothetical protein